MLFQFSFRKLFFPFWWRWNYLTECDVISFQIGESLLTREYSVGVEILTDIDVALHDGIEGGLVDAARFHTQEGWLEQGLWAPEPFVADGDDLSVRQLVRFLEGRGWGGGGHLLLEVQSDIAQLLLDVTDNFSLSCRGEFFRISVRKYNTAAHLQKYTFTVQKA